MPKSVENTVFVRFVPTPAQKVQRHQLEDIFSQIGPIKKSSWISSTENQTSKGYGFVKYIAQEDASEATNQLHNTKIKLDGETYQIKVELASEAGKIKQKNQEQKPQKTKDKQQQQRNEMSQDDMLKMKKKCRIIVRNLSFYAKEHEIRKVMESQFGKVVDVHIPKVTNKLHVGFCFVTFEKALDARKAADKQKVEIHKRQVSMELSLPKKLHQQKKKEGIQTQEELTETTQDETSHDESSDNDEQNDDDDDDDEDSLEESDDDDDDEQEEDSDDDDDDDDAGNSNNNKSNKPKDDNAIKEKRTIFLRNLPFDASRHDLFKMFSKFGHITGVYLVKDKETRVNKGTAFISFSRPQATERALDAAKSTSFVSQRDTGGLSSDVQGSSFLLNGRPIYVNLAVDNETASTFDKKLLNKPAADRRNLYLQLAARVESSPSTGEILPDSWLELPQQDQQKRQNALKDKVTKLKSPLFFINPNRLSVRNLARHIDEAGLHKLCFDAVKKGLQRGLVGVDDQVAHWRAKGEMTTRDILSKIQEMEDNGESIVPEIPDKASIKEFLPSVHIDREIGTDGKKTNAPSRGYGFIEFTHHVHALACLRELNNNAAYSKEYAAGGAIADGLKKAGKRKRGKNVSSTTGGSTAHASYIGEDGRVRIPRLIVDFVVENKVKAKQQAENRAKQRANQIKQRMERKQIEGDDNDETMSKKLKKSRGAAQRERKRKQREQAAKNNGIGTDYPSLTKKAKLDASSTTKSNEMKQGTTKTTLNKKKKKIDQEEAKFEKLTETYQEAYTKDDTASAKKDKMNPRAQVKQKRWFE